MEVGAFVNVDMEHHSLKSLTLALYRSLMEEPEFKGYPHTGIAIQAYLRESEQDVSNLIDWCRAHNQRITIRLVKGAYWDTEVMTARQNNWPVPVFTNKHDSDANFERVARLVLGNHQHLSLACGSHNIRSIAAVIETAHEMRVPEDRLEFQIPVRYGGAHSQCSAQGGSAAAPLCADRRLGAGHGLPRAAFAGEHVERIVPAQEFFGVRLTRRATSGPGECCGEQQDLARSFGDG